MLTLKSSNVGGASMTYAYDPLNRLASVTDTSGATTYSYDAVGNLGGFTYPNGVATSYNYNTLNRLTQMQSTCATGTAVVRTYSYGLELINERQTIGGTPKTSFYGYDSHGSVRFLMDSTGAITDIYDYDAFGNLVSQAGTTPNNYLFAGEQFDPVLGIYYNRARYYDQRQGRFWTMDTLEPFGGDPFELHRYLYASADPVNRIDPSGKQDVISEVEALDISVSMDAAWKREF